jgi:predicted transcriptional regulator
MRQDKAITIKVDEGMLNRVKSVAKADDRSAGAIVRLALKDYLKNKEAQNAN